MIKTAIKRPVTVCMIVLFTLILGFVAYNTLELAYTPDIDLPYAMVYTTYTGAGPEEVLELVTKPLEEQLSTITGIDTITSRSSEEISMVVVEFTAGSDLTEGVNDIRDKLERVSLPDDADDPSIMKINFDSDSFEVGVTSTTMNISTLYNYVDEDIASYFERIEGVASVDITGGVETEIQVVLDPEKVSQLGVSLSSISSALSSENQNTSVGTIKKGSQEVTLRVAGQFDSVEDIRNTYITTSAGNGLLLREIAESVDEVELDQETISVIDGQEGVILEVSLASDGNLVTVSDDIVSVIDELNESEANLSFTLLTTTSDYIKRSINNVVQTAFQAAILAVVILLIFLQDWKSALIIGVSIPTSIMATFGGMYLFGMTMNIVSMSGVVIAIGMLVDNSVVVLENIYNWRAKGFSATESAYKGTHEVAMAVFASTLTTVAVFAPFLFWNATMGQLLNNIAYTVVIALFASYVVSVAFVPTACTLIMANDDRERKQPKRRTVFNKLGDIVNGGLERLDYIYSKFLGLCLRHRIITVIAVIVLFFLTISTAGGLGMDLIASSDEGAVSISAEVPDNYEFGYSYEILEEIDKAIGDIPEATSIYSTISSGSILSSSGGVSVNINLCSADERDRSDTDIANDLTEKLSSIVGADITVTEGSMAMGSLGGSGFTLDIKGDDISTLREISDDLVDRFKAIDGAKNIESSLEDTQYQTDIVVDRAKASSYGISSSSIASAVSAANKGITGTTLKTEGTETDINVMYPEDRLEYVRDLYSLTITTSSGAEIPLTEVAEIVETEVPDIITRENQVTYMEITGEIGDLDTSATQAAVQEVLDAYVFPDGYSYEFGGLGEMMSDTFTALILIIVIAIVMVFLVMASQFESLSQPLIIMFSMPLAITGGLFGLFLTGTNITAFALIGFLMLVGMVVNNGIVLIDYTNQRRLEHGMTCYDALVAAGRSRLRPILMTTLTTVCGMVPMALALSEGMEMQQAMGIVIIAGLSIGTLVTLIFIPTVYSLFDSISRFINRFTIKLSPYKDADENKYTRALKEYKEKQQNAHINS
ncbi:MAG: efflux RND transporter permease subunit [Clostridiales bacterium]|nr:efflux RND transporter permease subunit [Clostridiales bacterium]